MILFSALSDWDATLLGAAACAAPASCMMVSSGPGFPCWSKSARASFNMAARSRFGASAPVSPTGPVWSTFCRFAVLPLLPSTPSGLRARFGDREPGATSGADTRAAPGDCRDAASASDCASWLNGGLGILARDSAAGSTSGAEVAAGAGAGKGAAEAGAAAGIGREGRDSDEAGWGCSWTVSGPGDEAPRAARSSASSCEDASAMLRAHRVDRLFALRSTLS